MKLMNEIPMDPWYLSWFHSFDFIFNGPDFFNRQHLKHGDIYRCSLFGNENLRVAGADYAELVFMNSEQAFLAGPNWASVMKGLFPGGLLLMDGHQHKMHRRILQHAFSKQAMVSYCDKISQWAKETVDNMPKNQDIDLFPYLKTHTLNLSLSIFLGIDSSEKLGSNIAKAFNDLVSGVLTIVRVPAFNTRYHLGVKGRKILTEAFLKLIEDRKENPGEDLVSYLCKAEDEEGNKLTETEIIDHAIFLMMAAHDTTTSALTSIMFFMCKHEYWQEQLSIESNQFKSLSYEQLSSLTTAEMIFKESIRLFPPAVTVGRYVDKDVKYKDLDIPKGTYTGVSIYNLHKNPSYWTHPQKFDPLRFERKEDKGHPYQFIPFGGGIHKCIGMHLSMMEIKIFVRQLFEKHRIVSTTNLTKLKFSTVPIWKPKGKFCIQLKA